MSRSKQTVSLLENDPLWYKDAVIYEVHVRAFRDSNGDGIGDFKGLIEKLDYLQDLGVTALWILPFYPSPLRDDGYDIADYTTVNPSYGNLKDFQKFLDLAHERGLRVITELVINHTSSEHAWFQRARRAPRGSSERNFYVWSDSPDVYKGTRIIFQDFETSNWSWDPVAEQYYWHRFYNHQPDLNFDHPPVQEALFEVLDFWMDMGIDGLRLDAIPYLYEREGTNNENLPETHEFLKKLRKHVEDRYPGEGRMLLAEANQWPEDAAEYFGEGDECHMNFHFPLMPRMFMAVQQETSFPILDILEQTPEIPENCQWALFLRNHDELTLEMVTDEDRDYMYRVYAEDPQARINVGIRRRLAPLLKERRKMELMNGLLMSLPGTPVLYYGDEIGMGDNIYLGDRNGVRTPMQWSGDRNAGFSSANPQKLYLPTIIDPEYHYEAINVEAQQQNSNSLLWWMKRLLALRKDHKVFGRGSVEFLRPENPKVLAFIREYEGERILVVANLSRFSQFVELDLREYQGAVPTEMFGRTKFPAIGAWPYLLTVGAYGIYWFQLGDAEGSVDDSDELPWVETTGSWEAVLSGKMRKSLDAALQAQMCRSRWFRGKARKIRGVECLGSVELASGRYQLATFRVEYVDGLPETYSLPLGFATGKAQEGLAADHSSRLIANLRVKPARGATGKPKEGLLYDAAGDAEFGHALLALIKKGEEVEGKATLLEPSPGSLLSDTKLSDLEAHPLSLEQSNSSVAFSDRFFMKLLRHLDFGTHPDIEISEFLASTDFEAFPKPAGHVTIKLDSQRDAAALAVVTEHVANQGDAWTLTCDAVGRAFNHALESGAKAPGLGGSLMRRVSKSTPEEVRNFVGGFLGTVEALAERSADMHMALATGDTTAFAPEEFTTLHQRSLFQSARSTLMQSLDLLKSAKGDNEALAPLIKEVLSCKSALSDRLKQIVGEKIEATRIRCHGDFHLGQVLYTGNDFAILDFEGEPTRSLGERRLKFSPLKDVAGMVRSFYYAAGYALRHGGVRSEDIAALEPWAQAWAGWVSAAYLRVYLERTSGQSFIPKDSKQVEKLLDFYLVEKCCYELGYELRSRPDWVDIPLRGLLEYAG